MVEENEAISWHPWVSWHDINGVRYSGPAPLFPQGSEPNKDGPQVYRHNRPKFHDMLSSRAEKHGVHVEYGHRAVEYYDSPTTGKAGVILDNGEKMEADVVVAADGIGSKSSKATIGGLVQARSTGFAIYRAAFPIEIAYADPELKERFKPLEDGTPVMELWSG